ncbi:MAG: HAMP domain-containing histidine kinase, partial [Bdellovibrionaceae bacterium]|nr:HAMP domain-containing histidine kinase [Pseudobdellovibrionaceae bacterium]
MKISLKLFLTLGVIALALCGSISLGIFWYARTSVNQATEDLIKDVESVAMGQSLEQNLSAHRRQALLKGLRADEKRKQTIIFSDESLRRDILKISNYSSTNEEDQMVDRVKSGVLFYLQPYGNLRSNGARSAILYRQLTDVYDQAQQNIQDLIKLNLDQTTEIEAELNRQARLHDIFISITVLVFSLIAIGLIFGLRQILFLPFFRLKNQIDLFDSSAPVQTAEIGGALEIQEIAESFKDLSERLIRQKNQRLTFLASIAHDLKNPLGAIKMSAEILQDDDMVALLEKKPVLEIIARQTGHLERLVEDLLDTSRIESGQFKIDLKLFDLRRTVLDSISLHTPLSSKHFFKKEICEAIVNVMGDEQRISQVLNNLLSNAI